jgi:hypothetical protein
MEGERLSSSTNSGGRAADLQRTKLIGWRFKSDRNKFFFALVGSLACYVGVLFSEVQEKQRRHSSIQKDIEREQWRAQQLGVDKKSDDGFADAYIHKLKESGEYDRNIRKYGNGLIVPKDGNKPV